MVKLLNVKAMEKMLKSGNFGKITSELSKKNFTHEAVDYFIRESTTTDVFRAEYTMDCLCKIVANRDHYKFSDFYSDFEDYVNSPLANFLVANTSAGDYIQWFESIPNEQQLRELYENSTENVKKVIYKTLVYRRSSFGLSDKLIDIYSDSYNFFLELIMKYESSCENNIARATEYFIRWAYALNENALIKLEERFGTERIKSYLEKRRERYHNGANRTSLLDFITTSTFLHDVGELDSLEIVSTMIRDFDIYSWATGTLNKETYSLLQDLYDKHLAPLFFEGETAILDFQGKNTYNYIKRHFDVILPWERREDRAIAIINLYRKLSDNYSVAYKLSSVDLAFERREVNVDFKIPKQITEDSLKLAFRFCEFIPSHEIEFEELKSILRLHFPHLNAIGSFSENTILSKHINIEKLLAEKGDEMAALLDFSHGDFESYFKDKLIPVDVIKNYGERLGRYVVLRSLLRSKTITPQELLDMSSRINFKEEYMSSDNCSILSRALENEGKPATAEEVAELIKILGLDKEKFFECNYNKENSKLDLRSILTLL